MNKLILIFVVLSFNCSSVKYYFINRGNDFLDIFTIDFEKGVYGFGIIC